MSVMTAKLEKDLRNSVNRRLNCDSANLDKAVEAAQEQLEAIRRLEDAGHLDQLPDKLQQTAAAAAGPSGADPQSELAELCDPPVTKILPEPPAAEDSAAGKRTVKVKYFSEFEEYERWR